MVAGISGSFVELPKFDFNLTGMGEFIQLPLLNDAIRSVVNAQLANLCVLPNTMIIPLVPDINITKLFVPLPDVSQHFVFSIFLTFYLCLVCSSNQSRGSKES
jgi:hypothetical protein